MGKFINPFTDWGFKHIFGREASKDVLVECLNDLLQGERVIGQQRKRQVKKIKAELKRQYDGYHFGPKLLDIYNPFSLLNAFASRIMQDYWFRSSTPSYLIRLLNHTKENLNELTGRYYTPGQFIDYKADVEKPLPMIFQSGKDFDYLYRSFLKRPWSFFKTPRSF